jgi:hypothetical protein
MSRTEIIKCDIKDCKNTTKVKALRIHVIFTTDQTEGRSKSPYLSLEEFDICENCYNKILSGKMIFAFGAQGYNTYYFKE